MRSRESAVLKVNDLAGNPIEIAAVIVWLVADTAMATFEVDDFVEFVSVQSESAVTRGNRPVAADRPGRLDPDREVPERRPGKFGSGRALRLP
jgi:hypothetical protein